MSLNRLVSRINSRQKLTNDLCTLPPKESCAFDLCNLKPEGSNLRCSRPLCSSQSTGGIPTPPRLTEQLDCDERKIQRFSPPLAWCSGPSGPNSVRHANPPKPNRSNPRR